MFTCSFCTAARGVKGVVLEAFGAGNMPDAPHHHWLPWLKEQREAGVQAGSKLLWLLYLRPWASLFRCLLFCFFCYKCVSERAQLADAQYRIPFALVDQSSIDIH